MIILGIGFVILLIISIIIIIRKRSSVKQQFISLKETDSDDDEEEEDLELKELEKTTQIVNQQPKEVKLIKNVKVI